MCRLWRTVPVVVALVAIGCTTAVPRPTSPPLGPPADFPADFYRQARERGARVFAIDAQQSQAVVRVYRGGRLASLGHDHVVASRDIHGYVLLSNDVAAAQADLYVPLDALSVDEPALRAAAGLGTTPSAADIEGTRRNMLDQSLETQRHPYARLQLTRPQGGWPALTLDAAVTLHGVTRTLPVTVQIDVSDYDLRVRGHLAVHQTDFGITPYSVLGGALAVQDRVDIAFELVGRRY